MGIMRISTMGINRLHRVENALNVAVPVETWRSYATTSRSNITCPLHLKSTILKIWKVSRCNNFSIL